MEDFDTLQLRVADYIARDAQRPADDPEILAEIVALRIQGSSCGRLTSPTGPSSTSMVRTPIAIGPASGNAAS